MSTFWRVLGDYTQLVITSTDVCQVVFTDLLPCGSQEAYLSGGHGLLWMARALDTNRSSGAAMIAALTHRSISSRRFEVSGSFAESGRDGAVLCSSCECISSGRWFMALGEAPFLFLTWERFPLDSTQSSQRLGNYIS